MMKSVHYPEETCMTEMSEHAVLGNVRQSR